MMPTILRRIRIAYKVLAKSEVKLPPTLTKIRNLMHSDNPNAVDVARIIEHCLTTKEALLETANRNSAKRHKTFQSVLELIGRTGLYPTYSLYCATVLEKAFSNEPFAQKLMADSKNIGIASAQIAHWVYGVSPYEAYNIGLVHNIGGIYFARISKAYEKLHDYNKINPIIGHENEINLLDTSHAFAGGVLAKHMGLNASSYRAIMFHHDENIDLILEQDKKAQTISAILMLANYVTNTLENENALTADQLKYRDIARKLLPNLPENAIRSARHALILRGEGFKA